jgi:ATPase subunit of ABC transporter with duplicated ATPase domains
VLIVTHDQDLIEEVGTRIWHFDPSPGSGSSRATSRDETGRIEDFRGTYEEYAAAVR